MRSRQALHRIFLPVLLGLLPFALRAQGPPPAPAAELPALPGARVTVLVDNLSWDPALKGENGASFLLETGPHRILFDTGGGKALPGNAEALGVSLHPLDAIVLSHHHDDHAGGLGKALLLSGPVRLFVHPAAFEAHYWTSGSGPAGLVTLPASRTQLARLGVTLVETTGPTEICPGVMVTGGIPRRTAFEDTGVGANAFLDPEANKPDPILDDQALFFRVPEGVVVVLGCGHAGVVNRLDYICRLLGESRIHAVIGGTHLIGAAPDRLAQTLAAFQRLQAQLVRLSHCTGARAQARFDEAFPGRCSHPTVGTRLVFGTLP